MHKGKIFGSLPLAAVLCVALTGCGKKNPEPETTPIPEQEYVTICATATPAPPTPTEVPYRDLGGMELLIGDFFTPEEPASGGMRDPIDVYRDEMMEKYNFKLSRRTVAGWGEMEEDYVTSVQEGEPIAHVVELDYRFIAQPFAKGLLYDLATLDELDFSEDKWNDGVRKLMTVGDSIYGMQPESTTDCIGVIFNKRLFEEAGLDPNLPYDLQAVGEWNWSKFEELCKHLTRDTDGDGQTDVYATTSHGAMTLQALVASTGTDFVGKDENGAFYNNSLAKNVTDAVNYAVELYQKGYEMPQPEDSSWDYFVEAFQKGKAAMQFNEVWTCGESYYYGDEMEDELGFVMVPKPDTAACYHSYAYYNIAVIPSCFDAETAGNIAYAYNLYTTPMKGYDDPERWKWEFESYCDERAVNETLAYFQEEECVISLNQLLIHKFDDVIGPDFLWMYPFRETTPEEQLRKVAEDWDAIIAEANQRGE